MAQDKNLFVKVSEDYRAASQSESGNLYSRLSSTLESMDASLREYAQDMTLGEMNTILKKLREDGQLSSEEMDHLKFWIVGDAEYYTKMENNYEDWKRELERLISVINDLYTESPTVEQVAKIRGTVRDAIRTIADIFYFVQQKERIEKFKDSTEEIDASERQILVRLLEQKIKSPHY